MTIQRMIELLEIEHECMLRGAHDDCDRNCSDCELVQDDEELHEMYTNVIAILKEHEAHVLTLDEAVNGNHVYYVEFRYHLDRGWVKCDFDMMYVNGEVAMLFLRNKTFYQQKEHYGQLWRLWSNRPTYEQMKAVKWDE